jgi:hypothetical protein
MTKLPWLRCCGGVGSRTPCRADVSSTKASDVACCVTGAPRALRTRGAQSDGASPLRRRQGAPPVWNELVQRARLEDVARKHVRADLGALFQHAHAHVFLELL